MIEWSTLQPWVPLLIVVLALTLAALSVWAVIIARRTAQPSGDLPASEGLELVYLKPCSGSTSKAIERALRQGQSEMHRSRLGTAPWFMMIGETGAGKTTLLAESGLPHPFGGPGDARAGEPLNFWLFDETAMLDPKGELILRRDGRSYDAEGWQCLLRQIREARPRRPLDGLVVTIPATRLMPGSASERDQAALEADASLRANALYQRLAELQLVLGMVLPVYVVITQADSIEGFSAFVASQPLEIRSGIFGWSSPYAPAAPYQASWTGEAFATFADRLQEAQLAAFGSGRRTADAAAFLDFPSHLAQLEDGARIYLNHLFSHSAFIEGFMMRGLYVTGGAFDGVLDAAARDVEGLCPPRPPTIANRRQRTPDSILFARDLLSAKVFPENALAAATEEASRQATLRLRIAQVSALLVPLVVLAGMFLDHRSISHRASQLSPLVSQVGADLADADRGNLVTDASDLVEGARRVDRYSLWGLFLPPSWLSPLDGEIESTLQSGYDQIVFPALDAQLGTWQRSLSAPWLPPDPGPRIAYVEQTPEFQQLQTFSQQLTAFDDDVWLYDCLAAHCASGSNALTAFDHLSNDLLSTQLKLPTADARRFYARILEQISADPYRVGPVGSAALQAQARRLSDRLDARQLTDNVVLEDVRALAFDIERLQQDPNATAADYRLLNEQIDALRKELERPEIAWMSQPTLEPGPLVRQTYDALAASPYVGKATVSQLEQQADEDFARLRQSLAEVSTPSTGYVLARAPDGSAKLELSAGVDELDKAVEDLLNESFMAREDTRTLRPAREDERLFWSQSGLGKVTDLVTSFQSFASGGVAPFPSDLQGTTAEVALSTLSKNMLDALAAAESFRPAPSRVSSQTLERGLAMQVRNATTNGAALAQILDDFQALQLYDAYDQLSAVLTVQQTHMLEDLDALLDLEPLFEPIDFTFAWWQGTQPPAPPAFGLEPPKGCPPPEAGWCVDKAGVGKAGACAPTAASTAAITSFVADETASATQLVKAYATPILGSPFALSLLPSKRLDTLTARWQRITTDVDQAANKQPGNALQSLGQFISETMMQVSLGTCFDLLLMDPTAGNGDYFRARQQELTLGLRARCSRLAASEGLADYRRYSQIFDDRLAGRYPFAKPDPGTPIPSESTPADLRAFFASFDQSSCLVPEIRPGDPGFAGHEDEVRDFVEEMTKVRTFFALFLDQPKKYPQPTFGYRVELRVNRSREVGADQIIDWRLQVADQTATLGLATSPPPPPPPTTPATTSTAAPTSAAPTALGGTWVYGEPSRLSLRWADEAPVKPVTPPTSDRVRLSGRTVIWDYQDLWSLLALVRDFPAAASDFPGLEDPRPETLKLVVGTQSSSSTAAKAIVFVRITFLTPDFSSDLKVPPFPSWATKLTEPDFAVTVKDLDASFTNKTRGSYQSLRWRFGDGAESRDTDPRHHYQTAGSYEVTLEVTEAGVVDQMTRAVAVGEGGTPKASFNSAVDELRVSFTDTSTGQPDAWSWNFGDGTTDASQNPTHLYSRAGNFEVILEASNAAGTNVAKSTVTTVEASPSDRPKARFMALPDGGNFVRFVDESTGEIDSRTWDFGDGHTSKEKDPGHLYDGPGTYTVRLLVSGPGGEAESIGEVTAF